MSRAQCKNRNAINLHEGISLQLLVILTIMLLRPSTKYNMHGAADAWDADGIRNVRFKQALDKVPGMNGTYAYSAQRIGRIGGPRPAVGDYVVANGSPWSFSSNPTVAAQFARETLNHPGPNDSVGIYSVRSWDGKPIGAYSGLPEEVEVVYPAGSAFRVTSSTVVNPGGSDQFTMLEIKEELFVPGDANILHFGGGGGDYLTHDELLTTADGEPIPESVRVMVDPEPGCR